ncbi:SCO family protein [Gemmata sp.]|uniref:SCO family protein n=1 Tax=Gemmata sp. TaxID=1914242 RepID=UPI003F71C07E
MRLPRTSPLVSVACLAALLAAPSVGTAAGPDGLVPGGNEQPTVQADISNIGIDQNLGAQVNLDLVFRDESERPVTLREAMNGKVTILVPVYFRCPDLCNKVLNELTVSLRALALSGFRVGDQFTVVTVSMDPKEHADLGSAKQKAYLGEYGFPADPSGWRFLTGKKEPVGELLKSVGFRYEFDKAFKEYKHPSGVMILTPEGKISRYFMGMQFDDKVQPVDGQPLPPPTWKTLRLSLVEASGGKIGTLVEQLTLACSRFDHLKQGYALSIMVVVKAGGVLTLLLMGGWVALALRRDRRKSAAAAAATEPGTEHGPAHGPNGQTGVPA